jgi:hypothetical protein
VAEGDPDLDDLALEPAHPLAFGGTVEGNGGLFDDRQVELGMP